MSLDRELATRLYRSMQLIRMFELRIEELYPLDEMKTPVHLCIGQEAVAAGVCDNLRRDDFISSNHRGHGHYLAKGGDPAALAAELYCRATGCSKGRGGSMHLVDTASGNLGSSSIVGGGIPIATGLALAIQMKRGGQASVAFFGDGAADEGVLYESANFAMLKRLPVIFVYENNQLSVCSRVETRQAGASLFHRAPPDLLLSRSVDGNDVLAVHQAAREAVDRARAGRGPSFLECVTYRWRGHAGAGSDERLGYRTREEIAAWEARCPIERLRRLLLEQRPGAAEDLAGVDREIAAQVDEAFAFARNSPLPQGAEVSRHLFAD